MTSKDKVFPEKFHVKESSILISLENFGAAGFSITGGLVLKSLPSLMLLEI